MKEINYEIRTEKIRKNIVEDGRNIMEINIEYPKIHCNISCKNYDKINYFYDNLAKSFYEYYERNAQRLYNIKDKNIHQTNAEIIKYRVPYYDKYHISVVCEITHFDGYFRNTHRISQNWRLEDASLLPCHYFLNRNNMTVKKVRRSIRDMILKSITDGENDFSYTAKSIRRYANKVDPDNYFLCERGIAFWFDKGTLAPESEGFPSFIIPLKNKTELP